MYPRISQALSDSSKGAKVTITRQPEIGFRRQEMTWSSQDKELLSIISMKGPVAYQKDLYKKR
jgi:hypothetical protein